MERKFSLAKRKFGLGLLLTKREDTTKSIDRSQHHCNEHRPSCGDAFAPYSVFAEFRAVIWPAAVLLKLCLNEERLCSQKAWQDIR